MPITNIDNNKTGDNYPVFNKLQSFVNKSKIATWFGLSVTRARPSVDMTSKSTELIAAAQKNACLGAKLNYEDHLNLIEPLQKTSDLSRLGNIALNAGLNEIINGQEIHSLIRKDISEISELLINLYNAPPKDSIDNARQNSLSTLRKLKDIYDDVNHYTSICSDIKTILYPIFEKWQDFLRASKACDITGSPAPKSQQEVEALKDDLATRREVLTKARQEYISISDLHPDRSIEIFRRVRILNDKTIELKSTFTNSYVREHQAAQKLIAEAKALIANTGNESAH